MSSTAGFLGRFLPSFFAVVVTASAVVLGAPGCSSDDPKKGCDSSKCAAGNKCLALGSETKCRKTCASNTDPQASCPAGYTCVAHPASEPFCEQNVSWPAPAKGQWGTPCLPTNGFENNKDCQSAEGFFCFGTGPNDAEAYCTRYDCTTDRECAPGFFCGDVNVAPNVKTAKRTFGETVKVCQRRAYCAPCEADFDCPSVGGNPQRCVPDDDGVGFCTAECDQGRACNVDAKCVDPGIGLKVCYPRAGRCKGAGELCAPCRSDKDCPDGACVTGNYSGEKSCTVKSPSPCKLDESNGKACPAPIGPAGRAVRCLGNQQSNGSAIYPEIPKDQCHGYYKLGEGGDVGCFTPNR
jgi:hypothetical protein